ncbi:MAG: MATE family efflux transporter [Firmicutes bacterium]|nr:MATE family efflux transporter [Bacillota bacterium]
MTTAAVENKSIIKRLWGWLTRIFAPRDMTQGAPWKRIAEFAVPMLIGNVAQLLYNTVDTAVVGEFVGDNALSAVGSSGPIVNMLLTLFIGISTGAGIMVAQCFGAKDRKGLSHTIGNCISLTFIAGAIIMIVAPLVTRPLLLLRDTPVSIIDWCEQYLNILFIGVYGGCFYNILSGILRGLGDSLSALLFLLLATFINLGLDLYFVIELGLGVSGVALATVVAQFISAFGCLIRLKMLSNVFDLNWKMLKPDRYYAGRIISLGLPAGLTQMIFSASAMIVQALTNSLGELMIACNVIVMRVDGFAMMPNFTFGNTMTTYTGQNVGAGRMDRVKQGTAQGLKIAVGTSAVMVCGILIFGKYLMDIFTDTQYLIDLSYRMMCVLAVGYIAFAVTQVLSGVMRGAGDTMTPMWISLFNTVIMRMPLAYLLAYLTRCPEWPNGRPIAIFGSLLIAWTVGCLLNIIVYKSGRWKKRMRVVGRPQAAPAEAAE